MLLWKNSLESDCSKCLKEFKKAPYDNSVECQIPMEVRVEHLRPVSAFKNESFL